MLAPETRASERRARGEARGLEREGARAIERRDDDDGRRRGPGADAGDAGDERDGRDGDDAERTRGAAAGSSTRGVAKVRGIVVTAQGASREIATSERGERGARDAKRGEASEMETDDDTARAGSKT